jgi:hypothetical protein
MSKKPTTLPKARKDRWRRRAELKRIEAMRLVQLAKRAIDHAVSWKRNRPRRELEVVLGLHVANRDIHCRGGRLSTLRFSLLFSFSPFVF